jgi:hypothetical protein
MYDVIWLDAALDQLADVYTAADRDTQDRIAAAVDAFNQRLARDPHNEGESRAGRYRIAFPRPLAVRFWIDDAARVVRVTAVGPAGR